MAEKTSVDVAEFEKVREQIIKDENGPDWQLAKSFEHTSAYRKANNASIFKVSREFYWRLRYKSIFSLSANWSEFPRKIVSCY